MFSIGLNVIHLSDVILNVMAPSKEMDEILPVNTHSVYYHQDSCSWLHNVKVTYIGIVMEILYSKLTRSPPKTSSVAFPTLFKT